MPWGRLDDGLYDHPKLDLLGRDRLPGVGLWSLAISWSNRRLTDGFVPNDRIRLLGGTRALAEKLVVAELFEVADGGYQVHDFLEFNDSKAVIEARRAEDAARKRRKRHGGHDEDSATDSDMDSGTESGRTPPRTPPGTPGGTRARPRDRPRPDPTRPNPDQESRPGQEPDRITTSPPPPPAEGRRANGTSPRQLGTNARANGTSPRQERQAEKRGPTRLGDILGEVRRRHDDDEPPEWAR